MDFLVILILVIFCAMQFNAIVKNAFLSIVAAVCVMVALQNLQIIDLNIP